jgi:hypothetical protein
MDLSSCTLNYEGAFLVVDYWNLIITEVNPPWIESKLLLSSYYKNLIAISAISQIFT